jgi:uncharacterized protein DUF4382
VRKIDRRKDRVQILNGAESGMKNKKTLITLCLSSGVLLAGLIAIACGSTIGSPSSGSGMGMATVSISDPATCAGPDGPYAHVYVTITDVQANVSSTAGDNDSGWKDLTPTLTSNPKQIDLLGQANNQCFLATLGDAQQLQAGNYQQIRLILADNSLNIANNLCTNSANCVVLSSDNSVHTLQLSSESKTGLKIPSGQIASGAFNIASGQTKDLNIDFNTCSSIVQEGNGQYRLKPVLHAGEVSTTSTSINGTVLDKSTGKPVDGAVLVALEQKDSTGVDRIVMSTLAGTDGSFVFCPIPAGTYDVVIVGMNASGTAYQPSIITGVANGQTTGNVNLWPGTVGTQGAATFSGTVTSQNSSNAGTVADVALSALETDTASGMTFTIPLLPNSQQSSATFAAETTATSTCPTGTDCVNYSMTLPAGGPYIGAYSSSGSTLTLSAPLATYVIDGQAFVPSSGGVADCTPSEQKTQSYALSSNFTIAVQTLAFTQCQ